MIKLVMWSFAAGVAMGATDGVRKSQYWRWLVR